MRIVGGSRRGRRIAASPGHALRPTSERAREALFNKLAHGRFEDREPPPLEGAHVLDAFAGTGAVGMEALSRGAGRATFIESDRDALDILRRNLRACDLEQGAHVVGADATRPPPAAAPVDIAFLDPPYGSALAAPALDALGRAGWLGPDTLVVVELGAREPFDPGPDFQLLEERRYGAARFIFLATRSLPPRSLPPRSLPSPRTGR